MRKFAKQWRLAFATIYCSRALLTTSTKNTNKFPRISSSSNSISPHDQAPGADSDQPSSFQIDQSRLNRLVKDKDLIHLQEIGGINKVASALETDVSDGISGEPDDITRRQKAFGINAYKPPTEGFFHCVLDSFRELTFLILLVCAELSPRLAIKEKGFKEGWYDGGSPIFSVLLVFIMSLVSRYRQNLQFNKLYCVSGDILIDVIRKGLWQQVSIFDIVVGDVVCLKIGHKVPADGLFLDGHSLQVDESSMTRKSDHVEEEQSESTPVLQNKGLGDAWMLVTSAGMNTPVSSINRDDSEQTPLQARLNKLTSSISKVGLGVNFLVLVVLLIHYFTGKNQDENLKGEIIPGQTIGDNIMNSVVGIIAATTAIVEVAIPEGLPLAVTLTLAYSMKWMMASTRELMEKPPVGQMEPLITNVMWRNLVGQAIYQVAALLALQLNGESIFHVDKAVKRTLIFNVFVLCQVFNEFNARKLEEKNVFEGTHKNKLFLGIIFVTAVLQVVMVEFLKRLAVTERLSWGTMGRMCRDRVRVLAYRLGHQVHSGP